MFESWLPWRQKAEPAGSQSALAAEAGLLTSRVAGLISMPEKAVKVFTTLRAFDRMDPEARLAQLPAVYVLLEQYLAEFEQVRKVPAPELRQRVKTEFPGLLSLPGFALIFAEREEQEGLLCRSFVHQTVVLAFPVLGQALEPVLRQSELTRWNHTSLQELLTGEQPAQVSESDIRNVQRISWALFARLERALGISAAIRLFESAYERTAAQYAGLDTFPVVVQMLPEKVLDEKKIGLLNRRQIQQALVSNLEQLQRANRDLESKNSELLRLNAELARAKQELDEANKAKSMFLASMSHELRTPLNAVLGFSQILEKDLTLSATQRYYVSIMHRSGNHLLGMINDVLDLSKIDAGQMERQDSVFDLHFLAQDVREMFVMMARDKMLELSLLIAPEVPRWVRTDESKLKQVLINLVGNAVKYTRRGFVHMEIGWDSREGTARFSVRDSGIGIPKEKLAAIFDPFRQVHGVESKGTGLGLAISKRLVSMLGGHITVTSELNRGSEFILSVSLQPAEAAMESGRRKDADRPIRGIQGGKRPVILIADDVQENRVLLVSMLAVAGFECLEAANGLECLEVLHTHSVDLVLLDLVMPVMDGYEALERIKSDRTLSRTRLVAITAGVLNNERDEVLRRGFDAFISKPFRDIELFQRLAELLNLTYEYAGGEAEPEQESTQAALDPARVAGIIHAMAPAEKRMVREALELSEFDRLRELLPAHLFEPGLAHQLDQAFSKRNFRFFLQLLELVEELENPV